MKVFKTERQTVKVKNFLKVRNIEGFVLDLGGGGEGIIGKLTSEKAKVISIDSRKDEFEEVNNFALKLVMDASNLQFINHQFSAATSFFTLMYMSRGIKQKVIKEVHRVLKPDSVFYIWDMKIPLENIDYEVFNVPLEIEMPDNEIIKTNYEISLNKDYEQNLSLMKEFICESNFEVEKEVEEDYFFFLKLRRK